MQSKFGYMGESEFVWYNRIDYVLRDTLRGVLRTRFDPDESPTETVVTVLNTAGDHEFGTNLSEIIQASLGGGT